MDYLVEVLNNLSLNGEDPGRRAVHEALTTPRRGMLRSLLEDVRGLAGWQMTCGGGFTKF